MGDGTGVGDGDFWRKMTGGVQVYKETQRDIIPLISYNQNKPKKVSNRFLYKIGQKKQSIQKFCNFIIRTYTIPI